MWCGKNPRPTGTGAERVGIAICTRVYGYGADDQPTNASSSRIFLYAFDLIELNGDDLRRDPLEVRKVTLVSVLAKVGSGIRFNEHL